MCDPVSIGIATAVGSAASLAGSYVQSQAASANQKAISDANTANTLAQNQGFTQRMQAASAQTAAQTAASQQTLQARNQAANQMRDAQMSALKQYQDTLSAENQQADTLRQTGDTAAQQLLDKTNAQQLDQAQQQRAAQTAALAAQGAPPGPTTSDPSGGTNAVQNDLATGGALARRTAEAATNIRNYGSRIAAVDAYGGPGQQIGLSIADTGYGIMPAQQAETLLRSGSPTRLLPSQVNYQAATGLGGAQDTLLQSKGQSALDAAGLSYGNAVDLANLQQSNTQTIAGNTERQKEADAAYQASQGKLLSGIGNLGLYGAGYFGGNPLSAGGTFGSQGPLFGSAADASIAAGGPPLAPGGGGFLSRIF
jgi:hypothetical protein